MTGAGRGVEPVRGARGLREWGQGELTARISAELRRPLVQSLNAAGTRPTLSPMAVDESAELQLLIMMPGRAPDDQVEDVLSRLSENGSYGRVAPGKESIVIGAFGDREMIRSLSLEECAGVEKVLPIRKPYKLVSADSTPEPTVIQVGGRRLGGDHFGLIAGPCTVESREQTMESCRAVAAAGATMLRGGAFKPRTSPYSFQGLGSEALAILAEAREDTGLPFTTEVVDPRQVEEVVETADVLQIGARNMQNFLLLAEVGQDRQARAAQARRLGLVEELLMAAEYILKEGNPRVILCERGIKTFERSTRFTLDISAVPVLKEGPPAGDRGPLATRRAGASSCPRWPARRWRRAPTASSWRSIRCRRRRSATRLS